MLERMAFVLDDGQRISALLNPASLRLRRRAGLRTLADRPGTIGGAGGSDDPLLATSGGRTEIEVDLLFDVELLPADPTVPSETPPANRDVRELTGPLWALAENRSSGAGPAPCLVVWGKHLSVHVVLEAVAERLEHFDQDGVPRRSFLSMRLVRVAEPDDERDTSPPVAAGPVSTAQLTPHAPIAELPGADFHEVAGPPGGDHPGGERLDEIAARYYGSPSWWRHLAVINDVDDPPWVPAGRVLVVPPLELLRSGSDGAESSSVHDAQQNVIDEAIDSIVSPSEEFVA